MQGNWQIARVAGIPIVVNVSWLITLAFVTSVLALQVYPEVLPRRSPYRDNVTLHWVMAVVSGLVFFGSILLHELAHSLVARRQGIPVRNITLFIFGGVSQIAGEARRPLNEFVMAIVGPLTSIALAGVFFASWWALDFSSREPVAIVIQWLFAMNLVVGVFNMAPAFPMDGGRVVRSVLWGISGRFYLATQLATLLGRGIGYSLTFAGGVVILASTLAPVEGLGFLDTIAENVSPWSGVWFTILGLFLESSARRSWLHARALDTLAKYRAEDIMSPDIETAGIGDRVRYLLSRVVPRVRPMGRSDRNAVARFIFFVEDGNDHVVGVLTEKEIAAVSVTPDNTATAGELMVRTEHTRTATPAEDAASLLQRMEEDALWHLPVVAGGRVIGVVSKERLLRMLARALMPKAATPSADATTP
jgi:Zn-dependent protease/CBS domain-containing protein